MFWRCKLFKMKRIGFLKFLRKNNCVLLREGAKHSVFYNIEMGRTSTVPRHKEINDLLARKICKDLGVDFRKII